MTLNNQNTSEMFNDLLYQRSSQVDDVQQNAKVDAFYLKTNRCWIQESSDSTVVTFMDTAHVHCNESGNTGVLHKLPEFMFFNDTQMKCEEF